MEKHFVLSMGHNVIDRTFLHGNWYAFACLFQHNRNKFFKKFHRYVPLSCIMHVATWDITPSIPLVRIFHHITRCRLIERYFFKDGFFYFSIQER